MSPSDALAWLGWLLAGICAGWIWRHRSEVDTARRQRLADAVRLHERERQIAALQRDRDALIMRLGRRQGEAEDLREIAGAAALAAQWLVPVDGGGT